MKLSVVGLGKLGAPMAACFAAKGHTVIGVDVNEASVRSINECKAPVFEPGLQELLEQTDGRLTATQDVGRAVSGSEITFLIVPTPSLPDGAFSLEYVLKAARPVAEAIGRKDAYHLVVLTSTVMPGATRAQLLPALEEHSGKRCPEDFGLCYSPEFISLGSVIRDYLDPDMVLIGESDHRAGELLSRVYQTVCENDPPIQRMAFANAELTKLAVNTYVTTKISYANMLAEICERLPEGNVDAVTSAVGRDTRIGGKYLKGSVGYGGPCFPRDNAAMIRLTQDLGVVAPLPEATDKINRQQTPRLAQLVKSKLPPRGTAGVLGLSYKPDTEVVEKAQGLELARALAREGVAVTVYDPVAMENARKTLPATVAYADSLSSCVQQVDVLVICCPWKEFAELQPGALGAGGRRPTVIDCWRLLDRERFSRVCDYIGLGTSDVAQTEWADQRRPASTESPTAPELHRHAA